MGSLRTVSRCGAGFPDTVHARSLAPSAQCAEEDGLRDWEDYKARVGEIQGVAYALDELKALLKKVDYVEDTDST